MSLSRWPTNLWQSVTRRKLQATKLQAKRYLLTKSTVEGPLEPPLSMKTLPEYFNTEILAKHGARPALIAREESPRAHGGPPSRNLGVNTHLAWDFQEFDRHINALARGLIGMGVQKGDRVGVIMGNSRYVDSYSFITIRIAQ